MNDKSRMEKTIFTREYATLLRLLKNARKDARITQVELAHRLGQTQSFVSKIERGEIRLDVIQLRTMLLNIGLTLPLFAEKLESELSRSG